MLDNDCLVEALECGKYRYHCQYMISPSREDRKEPSSAQQRQSLPGVLGVLARIEESPEAPRKLVELCR
jgi:hypothetical protein